MADGRSKNLPWWGWALIAVIGLGIVGSMVGRDGDAVTVETKVEEQPEEGEPEASDSNSEASSGQTAEEYDPCSTNGNLFIIRAEDNCVDPWPLDSASGVLYCNPFGELNDSVVYQPDEDPSTYYALNGSALASGYPDIDPIWLDDPEGSTPKVNLGELTAAALELCE